ncbi:MAG: YegP family protein [Deltaproteobacteria bacterium]|nr:YegP family protein [Deltaproteobacteria bacterium]
MTGARFDVFKGLDGKYYFDLRAANGEIVLQSQGYSTKTSANSGVTSVKINGINAARFEVRTAADSSTYFVLKAANGAVIGVSQMYGTSAAANDGIQSMISTVSGIVSK